MTTANLSVDDNDSVIQYTSTGETAFTFDFPILAANELKVSVDQVEQTNGTDYTVSGVGDEGGGTVTFTSATTAGELITIWLDMEIKRLTGFSAGASTILPSALNDELARSVRVEQMLRRDIRRALRLAIDDPQAGQDMIIPTQDTRAGKFLAFNAAGAPTVSEGSGGGDTSLRSDLASTAASQGFNLVAQSVTAAETTAGAVITNAQYTNDPEVDIRRYGPDSDFATALETGIEVACRADLPLRIDGDYSLSAPFVYASLQGRLRIIGRGSITYAGSETGIAVRISATNGHDVEIEGVAIDADDLACVALRIDNDSVSMAAANIGIVRLSRVNLDNAYLNTGQTPTASALVCSGGFEEIILDDVRARDVSRDTGAGTPTLVGSQAILVFAIDIDAYCKKLTVRGGEIGPVTNNEANGAADDVDCDGIVYFVPAASSNGDVRVRSTLHVDGTRFVNCKGRLIKSRAGFSIAENITVIRNLERACNDARDFGYQAGAGVVRNVAYFVEPTAGGGTTWGSSHAILAPDFDQAADAGGDGDGGFLAENINIFSSIPIATGRLTYFCILGTSDATKPLTNVRIANVAFVGGGVFRIVRSITVTGADRCLLSLENIEGDIATSLVQFTQTVDKEVIVKAVGNICTGSAGPVIAELADDNEPLITGHSNFGFARNLLPNSASSSVGELLRAALITNNNENNNQLAAIVPPVSVTLVDDATHTFETVGNFGIGIITSTAGDTSQAMFAFDTSGFTEITPASADIDFGTTSNPDTDGDLNIWLAGNGQIAIKNRLGVTGRFALTVFSA